MRFLKYPPFGGYFFANLFGRWGMVFIGKGASGGQWNFLYKRPVCLGRVCDITVFMNNLANILTLTRLFVLPLIIFLFFIPREWAAYLILILFVIAAVTDWLDGWVARKMNQVSEFGTFMDPISDKIFVVTMLLMLVATGRIEGIFVIAVILILMREFLVAGLREFLGPKGIKLPVMKLAKWKTAVQMAATALLIIAPYNVTAEWLGLIGLILAAVLTLVTGWTYLKAGLSYMDQKPPQVPMD